MYRIFGVVLIAISVVISRGAFEKLKISKFGKEVEVEVLNVLTSCEYSNSSLRARFRFEYKNKVHVKNIVKGYCDIIKPGIKIKLKTNKKNKIFLFPKENLIADYISNIILFIIGIILLFKRTK